MKITYRETIDEVVDMQLRLLERTDTFRNWKSRSMVPSILLGAPLVFVMFYFGLPDTKLIKLIFASGAAVAVIVLNIVLNPILYKEITRIRARKLFMETLGEDGPPSCEYELDEHGVVCRTPEIETRFSWSQITEINESDTYLDFFVGKRALVAIPKRAFENEQQKNECLRFAKEKTKHLQQVIQA